ncbi:unnamed protein product, partial [Notodromas monacha]
MSAYLVRLNYGLRGLSYMHLGSQCSTCSCAKFLQEKQVATVFYVLFKPKEMDELDSEEMDAYLAGDWDTYKRLTSNNSRRIRIHVHQKRGKQKLGEGCQEEYYLQSIFSIRPITPGDFRLVMHGKKLRNFDMSLHVNHELKSLEGGITLELDHGDIIECFHRGIPCLRVMFLRPRGHCVQEHETPSLLSLPCLVKRTILKYLNPVETMNNLVPVCRSFFELVRNGGIWTNLELPRHVLSSAPLGHLNGFFNVFAGVRVRNARRLAMDFDRDMNTFYDPPDITRPFIKSVGCWKNLMSLDIYSWDEKHSLIAGLKNEAFAKLKRLHLSYIFDKWNPRGRATTFPGNNPSAQAEFISFLGSGVLRSLHAEHLPVKMDKKAWILAQKSGTFSNLESLSLCEDIFEKMPVFYEPDLKSLWLQNVKPGRAVQRLMEMPSLEKLFVMCGPDAEASISDGQASGMAEPKLIRAFDDYPKEWLENLKYISDYGFGKTFVPYSKMKNLECVALSSLRHNAGNADVDDGSSDACVFEELRWCSKLRGLVVHVPYDDILNNGFSKMPQKLEFAAFSGRVSGVVSALKSFAESQNSLDDLWIHVSFPKDVEEILRALTSFELLKNVVLVLKEKCAVKHSMAYYMEVMKKCWGLPFDIEGSSPKTGSGDDFFVKQVTLLIERSTHNYTFHTYNFELERYTTFFSSRIPNFFSDWFKNVPCCRGTDESSAIPPFSSTAAFTAATLAAAKAAVDENGGIALEDLEATLGKNAKCIMSAYIMKINYGLQDLAYLELKRNHSSISDSGICQNLTERSTTAAVFYLVSKNVMKTPDIPHIPL